MIVFEKDGTRFNYRSVAIMIDNENILLHKSGNNPYWSLPGGRVEFNESANDAAIREVMEELNVEISVKRLLWVIENFFSYKETAVHELGFYFLTNVPDELKRRGEEFYSIDNGNKLTFRWFPLKKIESTELYPTFFRTALKTLPESTRYIVHTDRK